MSDTKFAWIIIGLTNILIWGYAIYLNHRYKKWEYRERNGRDEETTG